MPNICTSYRAPEHHNWSLFILHNQRFNFFYTHQQLGREAHIYTYNGQRGNIFSYDSSPLTLPTDWGVGGDSAGQPPTGLCYTAGYR
jgi:hypothetical protein